VRLVEATLCVLLMALAAALARADGLTETALPTDAQIERAVQSLEADPNLAREQTTKVLRLGRREGGSAASVPEWFLHFVHWMAESIRVLMWIGIGALVLLLAGLIVRQVRVLERSGHARPLELPTHVRDLDIRPESLPDDIGASALALWNGGDQRAALALLYRGMLSRLVHTHAVPIEISSTEGECLALAARCLEEPPTEYVRGLVGMWQRAVYGARVPRPDEMRTACSGFDRALGSVARPEPEGPA
jgi:hypothetical protein